jgi:hypothetical protein
MGRGFFSEANLAWRQPNPSRLRSIYWWGRIQENEGHKRCLCMNPHVASASRSCSSLSGALHPRVRRLTPCKRRRAPGRTRDPRSSAHAPASTRRSRCSAPHRWRLPLTKKPAAWWFGWWLRLVLVRPNRKVLLIGCWWRVCSERKILLAVGWWAKRVGTGKKTVRRGTVMLADGYVGCVGWLGAEL